MCRIKELLSLTVLRDNLLDYNNTPTFSIIPQGGPTGFQDYAYNRVVLGPLS